MNAPWKEPLRSVWDSSEPRRLCLFDARDRQIAVIGRYFEGIEERAAFMVDRLNGCGCTAAIPLYDAVQRAARVLPEGTSVSLHVEQGAGWVTWCIRDDCQTVDGADATIAEQIDDAIDAIHKACLCTVESDNGPVSELNPDCPIHGDDSLPTCPLCGRTDSHEHPIP